MIIYRYVKCTKKYIIILKFCCHLPRLAVAITLCNGFATGIAWLNLTTRLATAEVVAKICHGG